MIYAYNTGYNGIYSEENDTHTYIYIYIMYWDNVYIPTGRVVDSSDKLGVQATT